MKRSTTDSFILTLKLNTSSDDEAVLWHRMECGRAMYNALIRHAIKAITSLRQDKAYRDVLSRRLADKKDKQAVKELSDIREAYGLTEFAFHQYVKTLQKRYAADIDSLTAQKIASRVWDAVWNVLFGKGRKLHFCKYGNFMSLEGKNNASGIRFVKGRLHWNGLVIQPQVRKSDNYAVEALAHRVKYCRIIWKPVGSRPQFYLQLVLEGKPPIKHAMGGGRCGIDIGPSTVAAVSAKRCTLKVLAEEAVPAEKERARLMRRLDRSRRSMNPDNYTAQGTVKRGRRKWYRSKTYRKILFRLKAVCRKRAAIVKQCHERLANDLITDANRFFVEDMDFKALAKWAGETKTDEKGRFKSKRRFGRSIASRAPAMFIRILGQKLNCLGGKLVRVNTRKFKASQYDHVSDDFHKKPLSARWTDVGGDKIQRDLYSAFLLRNSNKSGTAPDRKLCQKAYGPFKKKHDRLIHTLSLEEKPLPGSFGIKKAV